MNKSDPPSIRGDYHTHTPLCRHAEGLPEEFVKEAVRAGLKYYGITDHAPMPDEPFDDWRMKLAELPLYLDFITRAKTTAQGTGVTVYSGLECDWVPGIENWVKQLRGMHEWDYLIGSVHYIGEKWDFDNPEKISLWSNFPVSNAWDQYWKLYTDMASSGLFEILGHADLIRKFGHRPEGDLSKYYIPAIEAMVNTGAIIELSTAGWHKPCAEQYPSLEFLRIANEKGVQIVITSDSHRPTDLGQDYDRALSIAHEAGYSKTMHLIDGEWQAVSFC